jgi:hypothetical protein
MKKQELLAELAALRVKARDLEAQLTFQHHFADANLDKCSSEKCMGSAIILELSALGGKTLVGPIAIRNGLSPSTIKELKYDIGLSYQESIQFKPKGQ